MPPTGYRDGATHQTGSLAFSRNLVGRQDYPGNPVLYEVQPWQGSERAMPRAMLYDEKNAQWVVYFCDANGQYPGIRAVGTTFSTDMVNWTYAPIAVMPYRALGNGRSHSEALKNYSGQPA